MVARQLESHQQKIGAGSKCHAIHLDKLQIFLYKKTETLQELEENAGKLPHNLRMGKAFQTVTQNLEAIGKGREVR